MRILQVTDTFYPKIDGISFSVQNASRYLGEKGHHITVLAPKYDVEEDISLPNTQIYRFKSFAVPSYQDAKIPLPNFKKINSIFSNFQPHIVHVHTFGPICLLSMFIAKRKKIPLIATYHSYIPDFLMYASPEKLLHFERLVSHLERSGINRDKIADAINEIKTNIVAVRERFRIKKQRKKESFHIRTIWAMTRLLYNFSDLVIGPTSSIKRVLLKHGIRNVVVVSNGIELDLFNVKGKYSSFPKFIHVGRLGFEKRIDVVINAMADVIKRYPNANLSIAGDGPARKNLEEMIKKLKLEKNIKFYGFIKRKNLPSLYRKHDVFVTASEMETQGLVLLEAMACGLPVIGANVLAIPDVVHNGKTGFLVKKRNSKEMAEKMIYMIEHPNLIKKFGKRARKEADGHELKKCLDKLEKEYTNIIS